MAFVLFIVALLVRLSMLQNGIFFEGEVGHNYLAIKNFIANREIPLVGPPTSHEWLSFGPMYYWFFGPFFALFGYHPLVGSLIFALLHSFIPVLHYLIARKFVSKNIAFATSFLLISSPFLLRVAWQARFFSLVIPLLYLLIYVLISNFSKRKKLMLASLLYAVILNFHLSPVVLLPPLLYMLFTQHEYFKKKDYVSALAIVLGVYSPLLYADMFNGFTMMRQLVLWFPYRVAGFFGLYPKNTLDQSTLIENVVAIRDFLSQSVMMMNTSIFAITVILCTVFIYKKTSSAKGKTKKTYIFMHLLFFCGLAGIFIHGRPPYHYFLPLVPFVFFYVALAIEHVAKTARAQWPAYVLVALVCCVNMIALQQTDWFTKTIPYKKQEVIAKAIVRDANGAHYSLKRVGPDDHFEGDFAQNYQYLLWYFGNEPRPGSSMIYTISEHNDGNVTFVKEVQ